MPDDEVNGHSPVEDLPDIQTASADPSEGRFTPGLEKILIQPNAGRGMWDPIERVMKGSDIPEDFLRLTNVPEAAVGRHMRIQYVKNLARHGNGRLEEVMWSGYNLRCSVEGDLLDLIAQMVTGQRQSKNKTWEQKRRGIVNRATSTNPMADNEQRLNAA